MSKTAKPAKKKSAAAAPAAAAPKNTIHPHVISFRLSDEKNTELQKEYERGATFVNTKCQMARKIVNDFLAGRLTYKNPADRHVDLERLNNAG